MRCDGRVRVWLVGGGARSCDGRVRGWMVVEGLGGKRESENGGCTSPSEDLGWGWEGCDIFVCV